MRKRGAVISSLALLAARSAAAPRTADALPLMRPGSPVTAIAFAADDEPDACCDPRGPARRRCRRETRFLGYRFDPRRACGERRVRAPFAGRGVPSAAAPSPRFAAPAESEERPILRARPARPREEERRFERMRAEERFGRAPEEGARMRVRRETPEEAPRFGGEAVGGRAAEGSRALGSAPAPLARAAMPARFAVPAAGATEEGARPRVRRETPAEAPTVFGRAAPAAEMPRAAPAEQAARFGAPVGALRPPEPAAHVGFPAMGMAAAPAHPTGAPAGAPTMNPAVMPHMAAPAAMPAAAPHMAPAAALPPMMAPPAAPHVAPPPAMPPPPPALPSPAPAAAHPPGTPVPLR